MAVSDIYVSFYFQLTTWLRMEWRHLTLSSQQHYHDCTRPLHRVTGIPRGDEQRGEWGLLAGMWTVLAVGLDGMHLNDILEVVWGRNGKRVREVNEVMFYTSIYLTRCRLTLRKRRHTGFPYHQIGFSLLDRLPPSSSRTCSPHGIVNYSFLLPQVQTMIRISWTISWS